MYTIGEVAKFLGVSRDTLKFYEEKGLVKPKQDEDNRYRKYNDHDIYDVLTTNFYRQLDIDVKSIQEIRSTKSIEQIEQLLDEKRQSLEAEIAYKKRLLERVEEVQVGCANIQNYLGHYTIKEMGPFVVTGEITNFDAYDEYEVIKKNTYPFKEAITLTAIRRIISFDEYGMTGNRCVVVEAIEPSQVANGGKFIYHPRCIYTIVEEGRGGQGEVDVAKSIETYLKKIGSENGYEPEGLVYVNILLATYEKGLERSFLEIYAPIKN